MRIGPYKLSSPLILAPMAGITDRPFRELCRQMGAGLAISEMVASNPALRNNKRTQLKARLEGEPEPRCVQIVGANPKQMAEAARYNAERGAQIVDINMGCPAKKVCNVAAGSALLRNEKLVAEILEAVVNAVEIPVTLKIRTGWDKSNRNALRIAELAEASGIQALTIHGRTRACGYTGDAEYQTIHDVKSGTGIPVIANGDVDAPEKAKSVLQFTGADAIMIGRAARGNPWIFREINGLLESGQEVDGPTLGEVESALMGHVSNLHAYYGNATGVRIARKHIGWYFEKVCRNEVLKHELRRINQVEFPSEQMLFISAFFVRLRKIKDIKYELGNPFRKTQCVFHRIIA